MAASVHQRAHGQFYTHGNPFRHPAFRKWAKRANLPNVRVLEPFAGANSLIRHLESLTPPHAKTISRSTSNRALRT